MALKLIFSPCSIEGSSTIITFKTDHVAPGKPSQLLEKAAVIPEVPSNDDTLACILPVLDRLICEDNARYFLRPVDPVVDQAELYPKLISKPIDFGSIRKNANNKLYSTFNEFSNDVKLLISNACSFNPIEHEVHQAALKLSFTFLDFINQMETNIAEMKVNKNGKIAEEKLGSALAYYRKKKEQQRQTRHIDMPRNAPAKPTKKMTNSDFENLVQDIRKLPSTVLIGVVEILKKKDFDASDLPYQVDLSIQEDVVIERLRAYVDCCKNADKPVLYAWRPMLPQKMRDLQELYSVDLATWRNPPPGPVDLRHEL